MSTIILGHVSREIGIKLKVGTVPTSMEVLIPLAALQLLVLLYWTEKTNVALTAWKNIMMSLKTELIIKLEMYTDSCLGYLHEL